MNRTKLAFVKPAFESLEMYYSWCDGLYGAVRILSDRYNLKVYGYCDQNTFIERDGVEFNLSDNINSMKYHLRAFKPDIILGWGTSFHKWPEIDEFGKSLKVLLYAGGPVDKENAYAVFDKVIVENPSDASSFDTPYIAFGTNTDVFRPMGLNKLYPSFYPAAFALWKRHHLWAKAMPEGSIAVGHMQDHEKECYQVCIDEGQIVSPTLPMTAMPYLYNQSKGVCLTSERMGGCQRAALEAMACNIPVLTTNDSKASEFDGVWACPPDVDNLREAFVQMVLAHENGGPDLREKYILGKYDHHMYAKKIMEAL